MLTLALPSRPATSPRYPGRSSTSVSTRASRSADTAYPAPSRASRAAPASSTSRCRTPRPSVATAQNPSMFTPTLPSSSLIVASCPGRLSASTRRSVAMVITPVVGAIESAPVIIHLATAPAKSGGRASEPCARLAPGDPASEPTLRRRWPRSTRLVELQYGDVRRRSDAAGGLDDGQHPVVAAAGDGRGEGDRDVHGARGSDGRGVLTYGHEAVRLVGVQVEAAPRDAGRKEGALDGEQAHGRARRGGDSDRLGRLGHGRRGRGDAHDCDRRGRPSGPVEPHLRFAQAAGGPVEPAGLGSAVVVGDGDGGGGQLQSGDAARLAGTGWAGPLDAGGIDVDREGEGLAGPEVGERRVEDVEAAVVEATEAVRDGADPRVAVDGEALAEGVAAGAVGVEHEVGQQAGGQVESHAGDLLRAR